MTTFILLSKLSPHSFSQVRALRDMDRELEHGLEEECPQARRIASYALLGEFDFLHIFEAPDAMAAARVALLVNRLGNCTTQTLTAIPFDEFRELLPGE
ncbi:MAG: GYD domain-containing protein [Anaerolineae bacterium]|nr:GYD domain-containing protein [Anaerolineae bacterium]